MSFTTSELLLEKGDHQDELEGVVDLLPFKIKCIVLIFLVSMAGGLLPLKVTTSRRWLSIGNALSGGVFISAGVLHMLMESVVGFEEIGYSSNVPMLLFIGGILLPLFFENVVMSSGDNHHDIFLNNAHEGIEGNFGVYLIMVMLSVHSLVEGFALGVQDDMEDTTAILIAILSHKFFAAFALGVSLVKKSTVSVQRVIHLVTVFSLTTPIGIGLGLTLSAVLQGAVASFLSEALKAFAAGTFVYVALVEVILAEFGHSHAHSHSHHDEEEPNSHSHSHSHNEEELQGKCHKYIKFSAIIIGVGIQTILSSLFDDGHSHGH
eukprot:TRINITY_DN2706_c0_g1_i1.p1 TRINITY_DN2706_c0_g1~~TRINITY_DN2706_c0_g1_i1.p1  ORF type:complete len:321 (-),score=50.97 TRINITY_DN2706_c0_g1_i1:53-1015(-)